jgi:hypothetical protein
MESLMHLAECALAYIVRQRTRQLFGHWSAERVGLRHHEHVPEPSVLFGGVGSQLAEITENHQAPMDADDGADLARNELVRAYELWHRRLATPCPSKAIECTEACIAWVCQLGRRAPVADASRLLASHEKTHRRVKKRTGST